MLRFTILFFILLFCLPARLFAAQELILDPSKPRYTFGSHLEYLEDVDGELALDDFLQKKADHAWRQAGESIPNLGFTSSVYWFRADVTNAYNEPIFWLLSIDFPLIDHLEYTEVSDGKVIETVVMGDRLPFAERPTENRNFVLPVKLAPRETKTLYFRIASTEAMQFPATLWRDSDYLADDIFQILFFGLAFGFLGVMALYNFFLYLGTRLISHLYYVAFVVCMLLYQLIQKGIAYQYLWPESPRWNHIAMPVTVYILICATAVFASNILAVDRYSVGVKRGFDFIIWTSGLLAVVALFVEADYVLIVVCIQFAILVNIFLLFSGIYLWMKGSSAAKFLTIAWVGFFAGNIVFVLNRLGTIPTNLMTDNGSLLGATFEAVLASLALADNYNRTQKQAYEQERLARKAQEELMKTQQEANNQLELQVKQRTSELEKAAVQLEEANVSLKELSTRDALTGLYNRHYLTEKFPYVRDVSKRHKESFSLLLMDIDHFKSINDRFGHPVGDLCLKEVADCLRENIYRAVDICVRYGGEEFLVILPDTKREQAFAVAERLRKAINLITVPIEEDEIYLSVSLGLYTSAPDDKSSMEICIQQADDALYKAKNAGRNQTQVATSSA